MNKIWKGNNRNNTMMFLVVIACMCMCSTKAATASDFLNKCISSVNHKNIPGPEGSAMKSFHCTPWQKHSCCTWNTTSQIDQDGTLSLYGMIWDQCPMKANMSEKCKKHFERDTCFYECSPNLGPWIVADAKKSRKERIVNVPLCSSDCDTWYNDCKEDFTCNDNWSKNWIWSKKGSPEMCPKACKKIKEYFTSPKEFCENIFDGSFKYEKDQNNCMNLTPVGSKNVEFAKKTAQNLASDGTLLRASFLSFFLLALVFICA